MTAIGPGDWVQAIRSRKTPKEWQPRLSITEGAIYQVRAVVEISTGATRCGHGAHGLKLVGQPESRSRDAEGSWCPVCHFAPWPPPADAALRCEPVEHDEPVFG